MATKYIRMECSTTLFTGEEKSVNNLNTNLTIIQLSRKGVDEWREKNNSDGKYSVNMRTVFYIESHEIYNISLFNHLLGTLKSLLRFTRYLEVFKKIGFQLNKTLRKRMCLNGPFCMGVKESLAHMLFIYHKVNSIWKTCYSWLDREN